MREDEDPIPAHQVRDGMLTTMHTIRNDAGTQRMKQSYDYFDGFRNDLWFVVFRRACAFDLAPDQRERNALGPEDFDSINDR